MKQVKLSVEDGKVRVGTTTSADAYYADPEEMKQCLDDLVSARQTVTKRPMSRWRNDIRDLAGCPRLLRNPESRIRNRRRRSPRFPNASRRSSRASPVPRAGRDITHRGRHVAFRGEAGGKYIAAADLLPLARGTGIGRSREERQGAAAPARRLAKNRPLGFPHLPQNPGRAETPAAACAPSGSRAPGPMTRTPR